MKRDLEAALALVLPLWPWIVAVGLVRMVIGAGVGTFLILPAWLTTLAISVLVYGRITAALVPGRSAAAGTLLRAHTVDYLLALLIIGVPDVALRILVGHVLAGGWDYAVAAAVIHAAVAVLTLYVLPLVFLERKSLSAVLAGVAYMVANPRLGAWVAGVIVVAHALVTASSLAYRRGPGPLSFALLLAGGVAGICLVFVAYAGASRLVVPAAAAPADAGAVRAP